MCDREPDWKEENLRALQESLAFFSNEQKVDREKWVAKRLLNALNLNFKEEQLVGGEEPADVQFQEAQFQVKEIPEEGRRRTDEYRSKLKKVSSAESYADLLEPYTPLDISFSDVVRRCSSYAESLVSGSKYGPRERARMDLLCSFNWQNYGIVPPLEVPRADLGFRSFSVVSNRYCAVADVTQSAPQFLKDHYGKVVEFIEW